jgi:hypothetical protein
MIKTKRLRMRREVMEPRWGRGSAVAGLPASSPVPRVTGAGEALMAVVVVYESVGTERA